MDTFKALLRNMTVNARKTGEYDKQAWGVLADQLDESDHPRAKRLRRWVESGRAEAAAAYTESKVVFPNSPVPPDINLQNIRGESQFPSVEGLAGLVALEVAVNFLKTVEPQTRWSISPFKRVQALLVSAEAELLLGQEVPFDLNDVQDLWQYRRVSMSELHGTHRLTMFCIRACMRIWDYSSTAYALNIGEILWRRMPNHVWLPEDYQEHWSFRWWRCVRVVKDLVPDPTEDSALHRQLFRDRLMFVPNGGKTRV